MFEKIKRYYGMGFYKKAHIDKLFSVGAISQDEYEELMASKYTE